MEDVENFVRELLLSVLTEREMRFAMGRAGDIIGFGLKNETYKAIGLREGVGVERSRQIVSKVHRKLHHRVRRMRLSIEQPQVIIKYIEPPQEPLDASKSLIVYKPVEALGEMSVRSANCLKCENILTIQQLIEKMPSELLRTPNFGRKSLYEIQELLQRHGLKLNTKL